VTAPTDRCVQIVLAAGRSARMGRPKALLEFGDETALSLVLGAAGGLVARHIVVVSPQGLAWRAAHGSSGAPIDWVVNDLDGAAQIDSLACGLRRVEEIERAGSGTVDWFFVHPVDCPLATPADCARLVAALDGIDDQVDVLKPTWGTASGHPILVSRRLVEPLLDAARRGRTARDVLSKARAVRVPVDNPEVAADCDRPADYVRLRDRWAAMHGRAGDRDLARTGDGRGSAGALPRQLGERSFERRERGGVDRVAADVGEADESAAVDGEARDAGDAEGAEREAPEHPPRAADPAVGVDEE